ncbi:MAG: hypothetical protein JOZ46_08740 [Candidatus Dormibacteraeota bacterium]|nr:hypothetical protein [Candidatus Dormibacteraeota bacterium]MBV9525883.1 hypothetical protein [Candidatus Dormibacteraeota bacterium]
MPDDRPARPARPTDRQSFQAARPFRPGPRPDAGPPPHHSVRIRDGDREIEVTGSPMFVRQVLEDLHNIWAQLGGEPPRQPASIRMPSPAPRPADPDPSSAEAGEVATG